MLTAGQPYNKEEMLLLFLLFSFSFCRIFFNLLILYTHLCRKKSNDLERHHSHAWWYFYSLHLRSKDKRTTGHSKPAELHRPRCFLQKVQVSPSLDSTASPTHTNTHTYPFIYYKTNKKNQRNGLRHLLPGLISKSSILRAPQSGENQVLKIVLCPPRVAWQCINAHIHV